MSDAIIGSAENSTNPTIQGEMNRSPVSASRRARLDRRPVIRSVQTFGLPSVLDVASTTDGQPDGGDAGTVSEPSPVRADGGADQPPVEDGLQRLQVGVDLLVEVETLGRPELVAEGLVGRVRLGEVGHRSLVARDVGELEHLGRDGPVDLDRARTARRGPRRTRHAGSRWPGARPRSGRGRHSRRRTSPPRTLRPDAPWSP